MPDFDVSYGRIRQESRFDQTGAESVAVIVPFYIGKHGPFTERFTLAEYEDGMSVRNRIDRMRQALQTLP